MQSDGRQDGERVPPIVATGPGAAPPAERGLVERRIHAAAAAGDEPPAPQRIMGSQARRVEVPLPDVGRPPRAAWPVDFVLVVEPRRGEVAGWIRSPWLGGERVAVGPRVGGRRQPVVAQRIVRGARFPFPSGFGSSGFDLFSVLARGVRGVLVALLLQSGRDLLQDVDLEQRRRVRDAARRDEDSPYRRGGFVRAFGG